ncbi:hypothetical protein MNBD_GAMMA22-2428 [hydrothermal vent metagenome]|uniref:DUF3301 domain-containing protein n=1 Tax=hydrothermal vent metagenome TaxID=652676 RepID=A0A3B1AL53_9ZZZZ
MSEYLFSLLLIFIVWYVIDSIRVKEIAVKHCKRLCQSQEFCLLDETVEKFSTRALRDQSGLLKLHRIYLFQYTLDDLQRHHGKITMLGHRVVCVEFEHDEYLQTLNA